jgi:hypothetical protein
MPGMTREDIDDLNAFVKAGRIDDARGLLMRLDGEKAAAALKRLNEKYPPTSKPLPSKSDPIAEAKRLIAQKDYDQAEKLLWESDDPAAGDLLRKLTLVRAAGTQASPEMRSNEKTPKTKTGNKSGRKLLLYALLVVLFVLVVAVLVPYVNDMNAQADAINRAIEARR